MSAEKVPPPIAVRVSWTCPTCRAANRVDEASDAITCTGCGTCHPMPAEAWTRMFRTVPERADPLGPGEESASRDPTYQIEITIAPPACAACQAALPPLDGDALDGRIFCPACGAAMRARKAPDWLRAVSPLFTGLVGEVAAADQAPGAARPEPVVLHCMSCGGALAADGSARSVTCTYCQTANIVPDAVWSRLHPVRPPARWYLVRAAVPAAVASAFDAVWTSEWGGVDMALDAGGAPIVIRSTWRAEAHVIGLDQARRARWSTTAGEDRGDLTLSTAGGRRVWIHDEDKRLIVLDPADGRRLADLALGRGGPNDTDPPEALRPLAHLNIQRVAIDADDTVVVIALLSRDLDEPGDGTRGWTLARYAFDGTPVPVWPEPPKRGFLAKLAGPWKVPAWPSLPDRPLVLHSESRVTAGADGLLYVADDELRWIVGLDRGGAVRSRRQRAVDKRFHHVRNWVVTPDGTVVARVVDDRNIVERIGRIDARGAIALVHELDRKAGRVVIGPTGRVVVHDGPTYRADFDAVTAPAIP